MWKYFFLFFFLFSPFFGLGQQVYRLTNNSYWDGEYHLYKGRIVWESKIAKDFKEAGIFLAENGELKQLTSEGSFPSIDSNYVTWTTREASGQNEIWYYDGTGINKISSDSVSSSLSLTAGKHIVWTGFTKDAKLKYYHFNGEKTEVLQGSFYTLGYPFILSTISEEALVLNEKLADDTKRIKFYDFNNSQYNIIAEHKDTIIDLLYLSGKTVLYSLRNADNPNHHYYNIYKNGQVTPLPDSMNEVIYFDSTYIVWNVWGLGSNKIYVIKEGTNYFLSQYPFTTNLIHPELTNLRFCMANGGRILYFNEKKFEDLTIENKRNMYPYYHTGWRHFYNNSMVWSTSGNPYNPDSVELYYFCNDEDTSCKPIKHPQSINKDLKKIYYNNSSKQINIELYASQNEQYNVALYDLRGRLVYNNTIKMQEGENYYSFPVYDLQQSIYLLRMNNLTTPDKSFYKKLLIVD